MLHNFGFNRLCLQFEGYKVDPNGEYVRCWLPELIRLPTEWIHHPWDAPEPVLHAAGIELGSNYPLPIIEISAAKERLQNALTEMWQIESASRTVMENETEEGLGDSSDFPPFYYPQEVHMEVDPEPPRPNNIQTTTRRYSDQMVPSITSSLIRIEEDAVSVGISSTREDNRAEVPTNVNFDEQTSGEIDQDGARAVRNNTVLEFNPERLQNRAEFSEESSSSHTERDGGFVPVWSPSNPSENFVTEETSAGASTYFQRRPQTHQMMNWRQISPQM